MGEEITTSGTVHSNNKSFLRIILANLKIISVDVVDRKEYSSLKEGTLVSVVYKLIEADATYKVLSIQPL